MRRIGMVGLVLALTGGGVGARADTIRVPLTVEWDVLASVVARRLGAEAAPDTTPAVGEGCTTLRVQDVLAAGIDGRVEVRAAGRGQAGLPFFRWCLLPVGMEGALRIRGTPFLDGDWRLRLRDVEAVVLNRTGESTFVTRRLTAVAAPQVRDEVERLVIDLGPPVDEARALIRAVMTGEEETTALAVIESVRPGDVVVAHDGVVVPMFLDVPPAQPELVGPPAPLGPDDAARWRAALDRWDAFVVFVVKTLGLDRTDPEILRGLFEVFLHARHGLADAIEEAPVPGSDPVRALFRDTWSEMRAVVRLAVRDGPADDRMLRYLAFLTAGDALAALDQAGPRLGIEISADGLRRLARAIDPEALDPLIGTGDAVDPDLQRILGLHEPAVPDPGDAVPPAAPPEPRSWLWPLVGVAYAEEPSPDRTLREAGRALDHWVPGPGEIGRYRRLTSRLLDATAALEGPANDVPASARTLFRRLVRSAAWQESCWRHFLRRGGRVVVLESSSGDVGLMQVNRRVWRGVFDIGRLERDVVYNAAVGAEILAQLLVRYGLAEARRPGGNAARAAYAGYQGGPRAHRRYRIGGGTAYARGVDRAFWRKHQMTERGEELGHVPCGGFEA